MTCAYAEKVTYPSSFTAHRALGKIRRRMKCHRGLEVYRCRACGGFHLGRSSERSRKP